MFSTSYSTLIGILIVATVISIMIYCVRFKHIHRHISPHPMQVVVVAQPYQQQLQYPQTCWSIPVEQPPPPYNTVMTAMNTNYNTIHANNGP